MVLVGWTMCIRDKERSMAYWMRCVQSGETMNVIPPARQRRTVSLVSRSSRSASRSGRQGPPVVWHLRDIHDSNYWSIRMRDSAVELERMVDERTAALRLLSSA